MILYRPCKQTVLTNDWSWTQTKCSKRNYSVFVASFQPRPGLEISPCGPSYARALRIVASKSVESLATGRKLPISSLAPNPPARKTSSADMEASMLVSPSIPICWEGSVFMTFSLLLLVCTSCGELETDSVTSFSTITEGSSLSSDVKKKRKLQIEGRKEGRHWNSQQKLTDELRRTRYWVWDDFSRSFSNSSMKMLTILWKFCIWECTKQFLPTSSIPLKIIVGLDPESNIEAEWYSMKTKLKSRRRIVTKQKIKKNQTHSYSTESAWFSLEANRKQNT